jgi:hypothetical protein
LKAAATLVTANQLQAEIAGVRMWAVAFFADKKLLDSSDFATSFNLNLSF